MQNADAGGYSKAEQRFQLNDARHAISEAGRALAAAARATDDPLVRDALRTCALDVERLSKRVNNVAKFCGCGAV